MNRQIQGPELGNYRLEFFNGVDWEVGHPEHWNITPAQWEAMEPAVRGWHCMWRLIQVRVITQSNIITPEV